MPQFLILSLVSLFSLNLLARPICLIGENSTGYFVYETETQKILSRHGFQRAEDCAQAISASDSRIVCVPAESDPRLLGIVLTATGERVGETAFAYTEIRFCAEALRYSQGGTVCVPGAYSNTFDLVDFVTQAKIGQSFSSVHYCKWASASASWDGSDPYICAMNRLGYAEVFNRSSNKMMGKAFASTEKCNQFLKVLRNEQ